MPMSDLLGTTFSGGFLGGGKKAVAGNNMRGCIQRKGDGGKASPEATKLTRNILNSSSY